MRKSFTVISLFFLIATITTGCTEDTTIETQWPEELAAFGNGFPNDGDRCRRLGESDFTNQYLDHSASLIGCPGGQSSELVQKVLASVGGSVVAETDGFTLLTVPD